MKFAANGCWDMLVLVANSFHRLDTKTKTIEAKLWMQTNGVHTNARFAADKAMRLDTIIIYLL